MTSAVSYSTLSKWMPIHEAVPKGRDNPFLMPLPVDAIQVVPRASYMVRGSDKSFVDHVVGRSVTRVYIKSTAHSTPERTYVYAFENIQNTDPTKIWSISPDPTSFPLVLLEPCGVKGPDAVQATYTMPSSLERRVEAGEVFMDGPVPADPTPEDGHPLSLLKWVPRAHSAFMRTVDATFPLEAVAPDDLHLLVPGDKLVYMQVRGGKYGESLVVLLTFEKFDEGIMGEEAWFRANAGSGPDAMQVLTFISRRNLAELAAARKIVAYQGLRAAINHRDEDRIRERERQAREVHERARAAAAKQAAIKLSSWMLRSTPESLNSLVLIPEGLAKAHSVDEIVDRPGRIYIAVPTLKYGSVGHYTDERPGVRYPGMALDTLTPDYSIPPAELALAPVQFNSAPPDGSDVGFKRIESTREFLAKMVDDRRVYLDPVKHERSGLWLLETGGRNRVLVSP